MNDATDNDPVDEDVRMDNESRNVWLVKIPARVSKEWDKITQGDVSLGSVRIEHQGDNVKPRVTLHLKNLQDSKTPPTGASSSSSSSAVALSKLRAHPMDYVMQFNDERNPPQIRVFSQGDGGVELHGVVEHTCILQPVLSKTKDYTSSVVNRNKIVMSKHRETLPIEYSEEMRIQGQKRRVLKLDNKDSLFGNNKRSRVGNMDASLSEIHVGGNLRNAVFQLFNTLDAAGEKRSFWTLKDLKQVLQMNAKDLTSSTGSGKIKDLGQELKEVLRRVATYHKSGENARCYELKEEYRQ